MRWPGEREAAEWHATHRNLPSQNVLRLTNLKRKRRIQKEVARVLCVCCFQKPLDRAKWDPNGTPGASNLTLKHHLGRGFLDPKYDTPRN